MMRTITHEQQEMEGPDPIWRVWTYTGLRDTTCMYEGSERTARALFVNLVHILEANNLTGAELYQGDHLHGFIYRQPLLSEPITPQETLSIRTKSKWSGIRHLPSLGLREHPSPGGLNLESLVDQQIRAILE